MKPSSRRPTSNYSRPVVENKTAQEFERIVLTITPELAEQRIDKALATIPQIATRSQATRLLQAGRVRISGKVLKPSYLTQNGDQIDIDVPVAVTSELTPYEFPLIVPYEDSDLLIVDKPAGLVVHPACGHLQDTLVNALLHHTQDLSLGFNEQRPGLVHRIDKDTSGLLVIAKTDHAQRELAIQFQRKTTHRVYRAIAFGKITPETGTIRSNLKRHPLDRKRVASAEDGKPAVTHYEVKAYHQSGLSLVELKLETGRTHQIRVHLSEKSHPIIGDSVYGADKRLKNLKSPILRKMIEDMPRFALHAMELGFLHPTTKKMMKFTAPWPQDLLPIIEHCDFPRYKETYETIIEGT
jgi:23S rRNA pseudouridine1911/1915/1917 synthase